MKKIIFVLATLVFMAQQESKASHAAGGELLYKHVFGTVNDYKFTFKFYRDCTGISEPTAFGMCYSNTTLAPTVYFGATLNKVATLPNGNPNGSIVNTGCGTANTTCNGGSLPGFEEWVYEGTVSLATAGLWRFYVSEAARNPMYNVTGGNLYIEATLDNLNAPGNSSPFFTFPPVPYLCLNQLYTYNNGAIDVNGDSLSFASITPRTGTATTAGGGCSNPNPTNVGINAAFTALYNAATKPLPSNSFGVDPSTGLVTVVPNLVSNNVITIEVKEWRNGINIGTVLRDIQVATVSCGVNYPVSQLNAGNTTNLTFNPANNQFVGCIGDTMNFCVDIYGLIDTSILNVQTNTGAVFPSANVVITGIGNDSASVCVTFVPTIADTGLSNITIIYSDTNCLYNLVSAPLSFTMPIYISPFTYASLDTVICLGDSAKLKAIGGSAFTWSVLSGTPNSLSCTNCPEPYANPIVKTTYLVTSNLTSICGDNLDTVVVDVFPILPLTVGPDANLCVNSLYQINGVLTGNTNGYVYSWLPTTFLSNPNIINPLVTLPTSNITYTLTARPGGQNSCASRDTVSFNILQPLNILNANDTTICFGRTVAINALGDALYTYNWLPTANVSNNNIKQPTITTNITNTYTLTASYPTCPDSSETITIKVEPNPIVNAGADRLICVGDTAILGASVGPLMPDGFWTYLWAPGTNLSDITILNPIFNGFATATYGLRATSPVAGCTSIDSVKITVKSADFLNPLPNPSLCPNIPFNYAASGGLRYNWKPGHLVSNDTIPNPTANPIASTVYTLYSTDIFGCIDTAYSIFYRANAAIVDAGPDTTIYPGDIMPMNASGNGSVFSWSPSAGLSATNIQNPVAQPSVSTQYVVNISNDFGCTGTDTVIVNVSNTSQMNIPKSFTPGQGTTENDFFKIDRRGIATLNYFRIFNRWGQLVFESSDINKGWDGRFNGSIQPMGTYVYQLDAQDPSGKHLTKVGNVTLLR
jgi:gliding motility-associated-like protein